MINEIENIHPGEILREEFLAPMEISAYRLSRETGLSATRISEILKEKRSITAETALKLAKFFGNSAQFWLDLQSEYDLRVAESKHKDEIDKIQKYVL